MELTAMVHGGLPLADLKVRMGRKPAKAERTARKPTMNEHERTSEVVGTEVPPNRVCDFHTTPAEKMEGAGTADERRSKNVSDIEIIAQKSSRFNPQLWGKNYCLD